MPKVAFTNVQANEVGQAVWDALDLINPKMNVSKVLIKPNIESGMPPGHSVSTNMFVVDALIEWIRAKRPHVKEISVAEGSRFMDTPTAFKNATYHLPQTSKLIDLNQSEFTKVVLEKPLEWKEFFVSKDYLDAEYVINAPVCKTHFLSGVSGVMANLVGVLKPQWTNKIPSKDYIYKEFSKKEYNDKTAKQIFERRLVDLYSAKKTDLALIDGTFSMQGNGPINGDVLRTDFIIASEHALLAEELMASVMGFNPNDLYYLKLGLELFGRNAEMQVVGEVPKEFNFTKPSRWMMLR